MRRGSIKCISCPVCDENIYFFLSEEIQGVPPWTGLVTSLDEIVPCACQRSDAELEEMLDGAEDWESDYEGD